MLELKCSRQVGAPQARVWEIISDLRNAAGRVKGITRMEVLTEGPIRVGTRFRETRKMMGRESTEEMEVTRFDPPRSYTMECTNHGFHYVMEMRATPQGTGTELEMAFNSRPLNTFAKVMGFVMRPFAKKLVEACKKDLDDLAQAAESRT
jgi:carbon monoxide dehydrogenase subunit G